MQFGIVTFSTDEGIRPDDLAVAVEGHGFDHLFLTEHSNIPASRETPYPGGGELPPEYLRTYDPFVALTIAAHATNTLRIGTGMCLLGQRDPIHTAKSVASLDQLSGGRFLFGIGAGWNAEEMRQHGTAPRLRTRLLGERVQAMKALWRDDVASFDGELVRIAPTTVRPRPAQTPHPPIVLGGMGPTVIDRVLEYADIWAPNPGWPPMPDLADRIAELRTRSIERGRGHLPVFLFGMAADTDRIAAYEAMGVDACVFLLQTAPRDQTLDALRLIAKTAGLT
ncbi:LLM class F420-dependent oxidoreductase [Frankia sp. AiPs1]|uniref:LLM class F420-dependent oxidoreductase n=1 Tax=Frankia sp. AiPs1 TaxID=573493 RepID=UPI0020446303|nr:LLM class F420-dependent oxidoreductase [Frankia sp. AiPs1]MCM3921154.1 LLM class F420-dependent oxidoreductase [Frankia sp. AiPs1]